MPNPVTGFVDQNGQVRKYDYNSLENVPDLTGDDIILVQDTQPIDEQNKIWLPLTTQSNTVEVPTIDEFNDLKASYSVLNSNIFSTIGFDNLIEWDPESDGKYIKPDGTIETLESFHYSMYIPVRPGTYTYTFTQNTEGAFGHRIHGYNENKEWLRQIAYRTTDGTTNTITFSASDDTKFIRISCPTQSYENRLISSTTLLDTISTIEDDIYQYDSYDVFARTTKIKGTTRNHLGVDYTYNNDGTWTINGTSEGNSFCNIIQSSSEVPRYIIPGKRYRFKFNGGTVSLKIFIYYSGSSESFTKSSDFVYTFPKNMIGTIIRFQLDSGESSDNQTVKYECYPVDHNSWIESVDTNTSDETGKTDMAPLIMSMLEDGGYCRLGEGIFYINSGIDMPEGSTLCGCGKKTIIRLLQSSSASYAVKIQAFNTISNIVISGAYNTPSIDTEGTRNGILFVANSDGQEGETTFKSSHCMMNNVWVYYFNGSGIKCHNTSTTVREGLDAVNIYVYGCWCGLNIDYRSEFNRFVNLCSTACTIACVNNGGNNIFSSSTFHANTIAFKIDGSQYNAAHGVVSNCSFCHTGSNAGSAITMSDIAAGFVVSNCQFWYNSIDLTNCKGVSFVGCEFGRGITSGSGMTINITGGNLILFSGCTFHRDSSYPPSIAITNNTKVKFDSCYGTDTGNAITAS